MVVAKRVDWRSRQNWRILYKTAVGGTVFLMDASLLNHLFDSNQSVAWFCPTGNGDKSFVFAKMIKFAFFPPS
jgi:hypothetical protein